MSSGKSKGSKPGKGKETPSPVEAKTEPSSMDCNPMPCILVAPDGIDLLVRAQPGARKTGVLGLVGDAIKLGVSAPPEDGRANEALVEMVADLLGVRKSGVSLVSGKTSRGKRFRVVGISTTEAVSRIKSQLSEK